MNYSFVIEDEPLTTPELRTASASAPASVDVAPEQEADAKPDVVILALSTTPAAGLEAAARIREEFPDAKLLFVTSDAGTFDLEAVLRAGARGYVLKSATPEEVLKAIQAVLRGRIYMSPSIFAGHDKGAAENSGEAVIQRLTNRESEILQLVAAGKTSKEIAQRLAISEKTVSFHRENIRKKSGIRTTAELTRYALERGLI